jgi:hypothetical protein
MQKNTYIKSTKSPILLLLPPSILCSRSLSYLKYCELEGRGRRNGNGKEKEKEKKKGEGESGERVEKNKYYLPIDEKRNIHERLHFSEFL